MREIKFRYVWATEDGYNFGYYTLQQLEFDGFPQDEQPIAKDEYTGLKDKKRKEIYFFDICKYKDDAGNQQIGIVKDYGYFCGYIEAIAGDDEGNQDIKLHPDYEIEVIGNIYENPELLK